MVEMGNTKLGRMLLDQITPVVMVFSTPLVEESCRKNGLSFIEMLSPFSNFNNIDVPVRTADQPYRLRKFKLRLFYDSDIRQPNIEVAKERLKQVITYAGDKDINELRSDPPEIETLLTTSEVEFMPPWFQIFNKELIDAVSFSEHEAFDHPVACLVAVSPKDKDPIGKFLELLNTNKLPSLLNDGAMDPQILKYHLLVHDNQDDILEKSTGILAEMRNKFGANNCRLLCINSSLDGAEVHEENPWESYKNNASHNQQSSSLINVDDIKELRNTMQDLSSKHIIPHMELKIRVLNQQVSSTRKGFKNQIKNLWWRKGKDDVPDNPNGTMYTFTSIESQIRVLGDYAFMLHDYELALSNYRLISTDYKLDKAWKRYAGVQEMMGLAYFMLDQSRKDAEYCMENAFSTYLKIGSSGVGNAIRCGLWWAEMLRARDQYKDAAGVFFRISGQDSLHSAVMLEQASYCYLLSTPSMLRKFGFHLVLSGDLYKKCDQIKHAIRTYKNALSVFKGTSWSHIRDHVNFHIGRWYALLGKSDEAIKHMLEVLACGHQSRAVQELFLRDFLRIIQETGKTFEVLRLQLPVINFHLTKVIFDDHRTYASAAAANVKESLWRSLEEDIVPSFSVVKSNWLELKPKILSKKHKQSNVCVAGEAIKVDVGFRNPLQIPLSISSISLICKHSTESDETVQDANTSSIDHQNSKEFRTVSVSGDFSLDTPLFTLSEVDIPMRGSETVLVQLTVTPKIEGTLKVVGVRWKLSGSLVGICNFDDNVVRKKVAKGKRKLNHAIENNLEFLVIKSLPRLEGFINDFPETVYAGDLRRLTLELKNSSKISVKNLKMKVSHPRCLSIADQNIMNLDFPACLRKQVNSPESSKQVDTTKLASSVFLFPETTEISADTPLMWPLWFRAATAGSILLCITIYYEMEDTSTVITYRTLRMHYNLEVLPSLEMSFHISPCPSKLQEFLVRMDIINKTSSESFRIHQISCVGDQWELSVLQIVDSVFPFDFLMAGQALSAFFKLKDCRAPETNENNKKPIDTSGRADVRLSGSDSEGLFDTSVSPLILFHSHERLGQERKEQLDQHNAVDFIVISESQSDKDSGSPSSSEIFSHHTCHCSIASASPIWWVMDGPRTESHDFSSPFCEINLSMTVYNSSEDIVSVRINTLDSTIVPNSSSVPGNEVGWHDTSQSTDNNKITSSDMSRIRIKASPPESVPSFLWSGSSSTRFNLEPLSSSKVPLQICVFSPGTFDLSNYSLQWSIQSENSSKLSSGTCQGHSYHLTVLQKD